MNMRLKLSIIVAVSAMAGGAGASLVIYSFLAKPFFEASARSDYIAAIGEAKVASIQLRQLRVANISAFNAQLEAKLNFQLISAAQLENSRPELRDAQAERDIALLRQYKLDHPALVSEQTIEREIYEFLNKSSSSMLGRKHPSRP